MAALCDVNFLLALCDGAHEHHAIAVSWLENAEAGSASVCRMAQPGLLRLLNNPAVMGDRVCTGAAAWRIWDALLADERFAFQAETQDLETHMRTFTAGLQSSPKAWQDAYFAAFARAAGMDLVTFDDAFLKFRGLRAIVLGR
ncbi:MAG: TA system VapC family ribonuclease toxin [Bryobacteraceae bacterium]